MLILFIAYQLAEFALFLTTVFQFFSAMITGRVNEPLLTFSKNATVYVRDVWDFLTFNSEVRPFPFTDWPDEDHTGDDWLVDEEDFEDSEATHSATESEEDADAEFDDADPESDDSDDEAKKS